MTIRKPIPSVKLQDLFDELSLRYFDGKVSAFLYVGFPVSVHDKKRELLSKQIESLGHGTPTVLGKYVPQRHRVYIHQILTEAGLEELLRRQILHEMCHAFGRGHGSHKPGGAWEEKMRYLASRGEPGMLEEIACARALDEDTQAVTSSEADE